MDLDSQINLIQTLETSINEQENKLHQMRTVLTEQKRKCEIACGKTDIGHWYIKERDDDYHSPGWYYTCRRCGFFCRQAINGQVVSTN